MLTVDQALELVLQGAQPGPPQRRPLKDCVGAYLAQSVHALEDQPPFASSAMDGYAVAELVGPARQVGEVAAGQVPSLSLAAGECVRIFTGAQLPEGTRAVVPQEEMGQDLTFRAHEGQHMRAAGEHFSRGDTVLKEGLGLTPARLGLAALLGYAELLCYPDPRVAIFSTGDEVVEPGLPLGPAQIRNSNAYALQAQVAACGVQAQRLATVPDDPVRLRQVLEQALEAHDLVITCAGASVGDRDYVQGVLRELGAQVHLWNVAMRPGKPLGLARLGSKTVLALPGNPVSCYVTFELFGRPLLDRLRGGAGEGLVRVASCLAQPVSKKKGLRFFHRCRLSPEGVVLAGNQASHLFRSVAESDGLVELPEDAQDLLSGTPVSVLLWPWINQPLARA